MDFVAENFERVIVMAYGTILADGTVGGSVCTGRSIKGSQISRNHI